jgi:hypothetical protein
LETAIDILREREPPLERAQTKDNAPHNSKIHPVFDYSYGMHDIDPQIVEALLRVHKKGKIFKYS